jgi:hypothetical protein
MADIYHQFGADLTLSPSGDIAIATGATLTQQRVLRRLLTNSRDYIWNLSYGAGLGRFVGQTIDQGRISALIRSQIFKEASVARTPEPAIDVQAGAAGVVYVQIRYVDATTGETQLLSFKAGA